MKNMFFILPLLFLFSCISQKDIEVEVDFTPKENLKLQTEYIRNNVITVYFPVSLKIRNKSLSTKYKLEEIISSINTGRVYGGGSGVVHFLNSDKYSLEFKRKFKPYESYSEIIYPNYQLDLKNSIIKKEMEYYIQSAIKNKNKFVDIMKLEEFKNQCPHTFQYIMKDQRYLIIDFYDGNINKWFIRDFPIKF